MLEAPPIADSSFVENRLQKRRKRDSSSFIKLVFETTGLQLAAALKKKNRPYYSKSSYPKSSFKKTAYPLYFARHGAHGSFLLHECLSAPCLSKLKVSTFRE
jgi:hypothetical protein